MADWRQIQARIRKAKNSSDPVAKLGELFAKTRDAMVAFEMGAIEEKSGRNDEAVRWYTTAAERFRRAEWRKKTEEALTRLGAPLPTARSENAPEAARSEASHEEGMPKPHFTPTPPGILAEPAPGQLQANPAGTAEAAPGQGRRRRRGRRGGRRHRRGGAALAPSLPPRTFAEPAAEPRVPAQPQDMPPPTTRVEVEPPPVVAERPAHGRAGEPALASRLAHLEALLRRLILGPPHRLEEIGDAPAGPGVFLLSDSDLVTSYYVEACQTLRVGIGQLMRGGRSGHGGRGRQDEGSLRAQLAEHLGISDAKVTQYLKQHCYVRWLQLDDEAPQLAHFAIALLRTPLNVD